MCLRYSNPRRSSVARQGGKRKRDLGYSNVILPEHGFVAISKEKIETENARTRQHVQNLAQAFISTETLKIWARDSPDGPLPPLPLGLETSILTSDSRFTDRITV
jgi:hypothetical protein